ncbi:TetR/AcrR family transcriptional regulator [Streptomyces sp. NPDC101733]|uniref:TetR/AcrR family transcriptional regulator n=1 Tax=unclassified Streptomyces TaxID=2593676 RepID=UPI003823A629
MGRVSQAQAQANRAHVVATASRMFREKGTGVSVADLMKASGLTHGGFYKQFASKEALVDEAIAHAFAQPGPRSAAESGHVGDHPAAQQAMIEEYLSPPHRDDPAAGCPVAGLVTDVARTVDDPAACEVYAEGVRDFAEWLDTDDQDGKVRLATMVGALLLARSTRGTALSDDFLNAARTALTDRTV